MRDIIRRNPLAVVIAVVMHIAIIAFMVIGVDWLEKPVQPKSNVDIVQAKVVDQSRIDAEVEKLKKAEAAKRAKEKRRLADIKRKQEREKKKLAELERKRKAKEKKLKAEAKKRAAAKRRAVAEKKKKAAAEKRRKATEAKKKAAAEKKRKAEAQKKAAAEKRRKAAEAKKKAEAEKRRKAAEAKKKAEAERKRKAAETKKKAAAEKRRKAAEAAARQAAEQKALEDALKAELESERNASEIDRFKALIDEKLYRNFRNPPGTICLVTELKVRLVPGGSLVRVFISKSSGSEIVDRRAEQAVYKAEPLPVPSDPALFEKFRNFTLKIKTDDCEGQ